MTAKPICVIKVDPRGQPRDIMNTLNQILREKMPDYYVFCIENNDLERDIASMEFEVYFEKNWIPAQWEELKEIAMSTLAPKSLP